MGTPLKILALILAFSIGCTDNSSDRRSSKDQTSEVVVMDELPPDSPSQGSVEIGPHEGVIVEVGAGSYHLEIARRDSKLQCFFYDENMVPSFTDDGSQLTISLMTSGTVSTYTLDPTQIASDIGQQTVSVIPMFESSDAGLIQSFEQAYKGVVITQKDGRSIVGKIPNLPWEGAESAR